MECFSSPDPLAVNATQVYDDRNTEGHLWRKLDLSAPLPPCSSSSPPPDSQCIVCVDHAVHAVCRELGEFAQVVMEAPGSSVTISKSVCPDLAPQWQLPVIIASTLIVTFIVVVFGVCLLRRWKQLRNPGNPGREETNAGHESHALTDVTS